MKADVETSGQTSKAQNPLSSEPKLNTTREIQ